MLQYEHGPEGHSARKQKAALEPMYPNEWTMHLQRGGIDRPMKLGQGPL